MPLTKINQKRSKFTRENLFPTKNTKLCIVGGTWTQFYHSVRFLQVQRQHNSCYFGGKRIQWLLIFFMECTNQLRALIRLNNFLYFKGKRVLINSYFISNFNCCTLVWMFSNATSLKKIENLQKRAYIHTYIHT